MKKMKDIQWRVFRDMVRKALFCLASVIFIGCSQKPKPYGAFFLVEGQKIGKLEVTTNEDFQTQSEELDSSEFDSRYLRKNYQVAFRYPGNSITVMKIFKNGKQIKVCDEASYKKAKQPVLCDKYGCRQTDPNEVIPKGEMKDNISCDIESVDGEIEVTLFDSEGMISRYRLIKPMSQ